MGRACSTNGTKINAYWIFVESQKEKDHYEDKDVGGWIILKWILEIGCGSMDWIDLTQDSGQWRAIVNTVMNLRVP
jgi:hypothetical protein